MILFLLYTVLAWIATACIAKILYISIQPGQWLDKLLDWQKRLHQWDLQGKEFRVKAGGMCELCFSHAITFMSFWIYTLFMNEVLQVWVSMNVTNVMMSLLVNFIWYICYVAIGSNLSLYFITKLFR